ncbi:hypothetical protein CPB85DRAFT_374968 [Mucidula mucida]|nr:hypothetical protein CPB85DRAFT_374968 [Mucidula mucida]
MSPAVSPRQAGILLPADVEASFMKALHSNDPLSDVDVALFTREIFFKAANKLSSLDEDIRRLQISLHELVERRGLLQETLNHWHGVVCPRRTIPNEILTEIFMHVCRGFDVEEENDCPWLFRLWKDLVLGTLALWANFSLDSLRFMTSSRTLPMLRKALSLSASSPLTFLYYAAAFYTDITKAEADDVRCEMTEI